MQIAHSADRWADGMDSPYRYDPPQFPSSVDSLTPCRIDMSRAFEDTSHALPFLSSKTMHVNPLTEDEVKLRLGTTDLKNVRNCRHSLAITISTVLTIT